MLPKNTFVTLVAAIVFLPVVLLSEENTRLILQEDYDSGEITIEDEVFPSVIKAEVSNAIPDDGKTKDVINDKTEIKARNLRINIEYVQNPVISMIMQTPAFNYIPKDRGDPFDFLRDSYPLPKGLTNPLSEYDYVIVGAGSSGCALAAKLTEGEPRSTVLLLEAGKPEMIFTDIPGIAPFFQQTDYAWQYKTERQEGICMGFVNEQCSWPRGRAVGGSSVINYMTYTRGRPRDWDRIAADGNYGWSYNEVLPYFINSERANLRHFRNSPYHGKDGEMSVTDVPFRTKLIKSFLKAGEQLGHKTVDYNSPEGYGFGYVQGTLENGHRQSAAKAFLHPNKKRKNLHILPEARALKVLIDPLTKKAESVLYVKNRLQYTVRASKEVILSAGPIASPQLLMLSGVGPEQHLNELGIPVIQNLKVGQTLYDHISFPGMVFLLNTSGLSFIIDKMVSSQSVAQWVQYGDGPATTLGGVEGIGYLKTNVSTELEDIPDVELMFIGGSIVSDGSVPKGLGITDQFYNSVFRQIDRHETFSIYPMPLHPKSKGYLKLKDANPFHWPKIYSNYLTERSDVNTFIAAIRHILKLSQTQPFQKYGARLHNTHYPTCNHYEFDTDLYWECAVRTLTMTLHDPIATCRMGPASDPDAVVDPELRVHGIAGLRIVDTGIIPRTISAHTHAPGVIIGLKAADLIKRAWAGK